MLQWLGVCVRQSPQSKAAVRKIEFLLTWHSDTEASDCLFTPKQILELSPYRKGNPMLRVSMMCSHMDRVSIFKNSFTLFLLRSHPQSVKDTSWLWTVYAYYQCLGLVYLYSLSPVCSQENVSKTYPFNWKSEVFCTFATSILLKAKETKHTA